MSKPESGEPMPCQCGQCFFLAAEGSKYCKFHRASGEAFDNKVSAQGSEPSKDSSRGSGMVSPSQQNKSAPSVALQTANKSVEYSPSVSTGEVARFYCVFCDLRIYQDKNDVLFPNSWRHYGSNAITSEYPDRHHAKPKEQSGEVAKLAAKDAEIAELKAERDKAMRGLESLTPSGSEFVGDVDRCVKYVRDARHGTLEAAKKLVVSRHKAEEKLAAAEQTIADQKKRIAELEGR